MESALPLPAARQSTHGWRPEVLFTSPWLALTIPLLVPLAILFW